MNEFLESNHMLYDGVCAKAISMLSLTFQATESGGMAEIASSLCAVAIDDTPTNNHAQTQDLRFTLQSTCNSVDACPQLSPLSYQ